MFKVYVLGGGEVEICIFMAPETFLPDLDDIRKIAGKDPGNAA